MNTPEKIVDPLLSIEEASLASNIPGRTLRDGCDKSRYSGASKDPSGTWRIPLSALPHLAQAHYWAKYATVAPGGWADDEQRDLPEEEVAELWRRFEGQSKKLKGKAYQDREACLYWQVMKAQGLHHAEALAEMKSAYGMGKSTIYDKLRIIRGYAPVLWPALLVGQWTGQNAKKAEWPAPAYQFFIAHALTPGAKVKTAWNRTKRQAEKEGWGKIPSYDTAYADFKRLPIDVVKLAKEGETTLKARSPTLRRAYDMPLHEIWSLDGRRKDLMVIDTKGKLGPAGKVFRLYLLAIEEVRSRYLVGYAIGAALNADLVRGAFLNALKTTGRIVPRTIQMDNGMENAAKEITGGATWRRRGKVQEDEIIGLFPALGVDVSWATPAHGQTKPVERLFGTLANMVETRPEFRGAYCGNSPESRPEEWDASKAVPLETVEAILREEIAAYHKTPHRGHGMHGRSPMQTYQEEGSKPGVSLRKISEAQERMCGLSAAPITIRRQDGGFTLFGAFCYSEQTARLAPGTGYYVRYNPTDLGDVLYVYRGEKLLCQARKVELTSFTDKTGAKAVTKARRIYIKTVKEQAKALQDLRATDTPAYLAGLREEVMGNAIDPTTREILPGGKVLEMVKTAADVPTSRKTPEDKEKAALKKEAAHIRQREGESAIGRVLARKRLGR
ncbi:MAG: hypothetical protein EKK46_06345 [Rhodocyclaceae bacterium]|nr:MAG: hypothetical protein EKK46_06345 [Rhodocyclaceae bacterium]